MLRKFVLDRKGVRQLLRSDGVRSDMGRRARNVASTAGEGFEADTFVGRNRARGDVFTETYEAMRSEAVDKTLTRAIGAAGD